MKYPARHLNEELLRAMQGPDEARRPAVLQAARALAEELVNKIGSFDDLLQGKGPDLVPPSEVPANILPRLTDIRNQLFKVMAEYGGFELYAIKIGDDVVKHADNLESNLKFVDTTRAAKNTIFQILKPGYVRKSPNGKVEIIHPPKVTAVR